jgi:hypothetical protein
VSRPYRLLLPLALAIGLMAAGCGSDSSGETTTPSVSIPAVTSPVPVTTTAAPATTTTSGKTVTAKGGKSYNPQEPDSETNDVPPKKGSPEEAFEQQCKQQGTCG